MVEKLFRKKKLIEFPFERQDTTAIIILKRDIVNNENKRHESH